MGKLILQIYEGETPLTLVETARIIKGLKDSHILETANATYEEGGESLPRHCDNKRHNLYRKCVGGGVCLAKKYKRCGVSPDAICSVCESKVITDTLNYMFQVYYDGKYTSKWRTTRINKNSKPVRAKATKKRGEDLKKEHQEVLNEYGRYSPNQRDERKRSRPKTTRPNQRLRKNLRRQRSWLSPNQKK